MSAIPSSPAPFDSSLPLPALARDKLMRAKRKRLPAYLYGAMGFGKTRTALAVTEGMKRCHITYHDDPNAACAYPVDDLLLETTDVLILDDLHRIRDRGTQKRILELLTGDVWIIFISRAALPSWLSHSLSLRPFVLIDESNFALGYEQICELMRKRHVDLPESVITLLQTQGEGNLSVVCWGLEWYAKGITRPSALLDIILELCVARIETELFEEWPPEILPFLARLSPAETFTLEMAEAVTGLPNAAALLQEARMAGSFLLENEQGMVLRNVVRSALWEYGVRTLGLAAMKEAAEKIGKYCEQENNLPAAIAMYKKSGSKEGMRHLLIANSSANASSGFYYDLRHEYLSLSDEDVGDSIELMSALAVLYDLLLRPEQSEYWRKKVAEQTRSRDRRRRQEALRQSLYLDICLIHTGSRDLLMTLNKAGRLILAGGFDLPEFSVTSNLPSLMNGGKDFSHWSAHDLAIARTSGPFISRLLGRYGAGLVELGLAESLFEKGGEALDVLHLISRAEMAIQSGGKLEMSFAACALRARVLVGQGQAAEACSLLLKFRKTLLAAEAGQMIANLDALHCRISLLRGDELAVDGWLGKQDDTGEEFFTLHRYRYLTLVRVWIAKEQYYQALSLLDKLEYYCELAGRMMHCIEINLLRGQIFWQMNKPWQKPVLEAMVMACRLRYYPIVSAQSAEICSMLKAIREEASRHPDLDDEWLCRIEKEAARFASLYPSCRQEEKPVLSRNGLRILRLQAKGFTAREIADILHLKMDNVQYHIKENYRRMQVSNKAEALLYAREIGLV